MLPSSSWAVARFGLAGRFGLARDAELLAPEFAVLQLSTDPSWATLERLASYNAYWQLTVPFDWPDIDDNPIMEQFICEWIRTTWSEVSLICR